MKVSTLRYLGFVVLLLASTIGSNATYADGTEKHDTQGLEVSKESSAVQKIPATTAGIWQAIDQQSAALEKAIQSNALDEVHHHAFALRDLAAALPERSQSLPVDQLAQVKNNVKFVVTLAERLDATGDAKDKAGTQANFAKLKKVLEGMRASYPKAAR